MTALLTSPTFGFLLKLFAGLATAGFGMMGIGVQTRNNNGRLNGKGCTALIGIIVAGVLAVGTSVYDFAVEQEKERVEQRRSQRLMLSVQRGVYPMHGAKISFVLWFAADFPGAAKYIKELRDQLSVDLNCHKPRTTYYCYGHRPDGTVNEYRIPVSSPLFPDKDSRVRIVVESLSIPVELIQYHAGTNNSAISAANIKMLGGLFIEWRRSFPNDSWL